MSKKVNPSAGFRSEKESAVPERLAALFDSNKQNTAAKMDHFPKYIRRQRITRLLALYEIFKLVLQVKGSIVECGVNEGFGISCWNHFSSILEPNNLMRRVYGFDTFEGFASVGKEDSGKGYRARKGDLLANSYDELNNLFEVHDDNRYLGHVPKVSLIKGDIVKTAPLFLKTHPHVLVSLLFLDLDIYKPTKVAIDNFIPRMPKGAVIAFDELDNPIWPGETSALIDTLGANRLEIKRFDFDPYIGFARIE
jgi:hypothetical protein